MKHIFPILILFLFTLTGKSQTDINSPSTIEEPVGMKLRQFDRKVRKADKPILIFFTADWCAICKKQREVLQDIFFLKNEQMELVILDLENNPAIDTYFKMNALPVIALYVDGYLVWLRVGFQDKEQIIQALHLFIP